jgi:hypothetical protein
LLVATEKVQSETAEDRWRTATWLTPFFFQIGLALLAAVAWVAGKWVFHTSFVLAQVIGTIVSTVVLAVVGWWLLRTGTSKSHARAYSLFGCAAALFIIGAGVPAVMDGGWR